MTIEFRENPLKDRGMIDGHISEVNDKRSDWTKRESYRDFLGNREINKADIINALYWAEKMQKEYKGTARIVIDLFGNISEGAKEKISQYPNTSAECLDEEKRAIVRKKLKKEWKDMLDGTQAGI